MAGVALSARTVTPATTPATATTDIAAEDGATTEVAYAVLPVAKPGTENTALALPTPIRDPFEPNDDIEQVDPNGDRYVSKQPPLSTVAKRSARIAGRIDR